MYMPREMASRALDTMLLPREGKSCLQGKEEGEEREKNNQREPSGLTSHLCCSLCIAVGPNSTTPPVQPDLPDPELIL